MLLGHAMKNIEIENEELYGRLLQNFWYNAMHDEYEVNGKEIKRVYGLFIALRL